MIFSPPGDPPGRGLIVLGLHLAAGRLQALSSPFPRAYVCLQVKQKWGRLRYYFEADDAVAEEMYDLTKEAEERPLTICEKCGDPGHICQAGYLVKTLCDSCAEKGHFR
jgi:hypothetical protein